MSDQLFLTVNEWMTGGVMIAAVGCFLWGMISVTFSPCHLDSIPLMVTYVAGQNQDCRKLGSYCKTYSCKRQFSAEQFVVQTACGSCHRNIQYLFYNPSVYGRVIPS